MGNFLDEFDNLEKKQKEINKDLQEYKKGYKHGRNSTRNPEYKKYGLHQDIKTFSGINKGVYDSMPQLKGNRASYASAGMSHADETGDISLMKDSPSSYMKN
ncbi:MAG: hypothetical protein WC812_00065 [Candidatus Pacearchaeota archaeon]|jgi:hypothetical protein